jgi:uncharacterized protein
MNMRTKHIPIRLSGRAEGIEEFDFTVDPHDLELPAEFSTPLDVQVQLDVSHDQVVLRVEIVGQATYPCDRCLEPVVLPVESHFYLVYANKNAPGDDVDADEIRTIDHNDPVADLSEDVRDAAMLCIPMRIVCHGSDASTSSCSRAIPDERNADTLERTDPRWDALKSLKL